VTSVRQTYEQAATLTRVYWNVLLEPIALIVLVLVIMLSLACAVLWSALERETLEGASRQ
jgi:hypothetical protein